MLQAQKKGHNTRVSMLKVKEINDRWTMAERAFTNQEWLGGRPWSKHMMSIKAADLCLVGPGRLVGTKAFPGIVSAIVNAQELNTSESWRLLRHEIYMGARTLSVMKWHIVIRMCIIDLPNS
ncbi:hypothetical protein VPH35_051783 [Triticum aestivum]